MMHHDYEVLTIASDWDWQALVLAGGETVGPAVVVSQCQRCKLVRAVAYKDDVHVHVTRYYPLATATLVEPDCPSLTDQELVNLLSKTVG